MGNKKPGANHIRSRTEKRAASAHPARRTGHDKPPGQLLSPGAQHSTAAEIAAQKRLETMLHVLTSFQRRVSGGCWS